MTSFSCKYLDHQLCIRSNGQYRLCCVSTETDNIENIKTHSPEEWLNSKTHQEARNAFKNGQWPKSCETCKRKEELGLESKRTKFKNYGPGISHLDLRFGNSCNLKCISCWPMSSSSIAEEAQLMENQNIIPIYQVLPQANFNWASEDTIEKLKKFPVKEVYLTGGEPMMVKHLPTFLENIDKSTTIRFNTNGTIWNNSLEKILKRFNKVKIDVSIDAIGARNEYIRFGSKWNTIEDNVNRYLSFAEIGITSTISVLNSPYMDEVNDWCKSKNIPITHNLLDNPKWLNVKNAPESLKSVFQNTNGWELGKADENEITNFKTNIKKLDSFRKINIKDYLPEVAAAYDIN